MDQIARNFDHGGLGLVVLRRGEVLGSAGVGMVMVYGVVEGRGCDDCAVVAAVAIGGRERGSRGEVFHRDGGIEVVVRKVRTG